MHVYSGMAYSAKLRCTQRADTCHAIVHIDAGGWAGLVWVQLTNSQVESIANNKNIWQIRRVDACGLSSTLQV